MAAPAAAAAAAAKAAGRASRVKTPPAPPAPAAAAKPAGRASRVKTPPAPPVVSQNPINAIDEALKKVETPVFFPTRIARTYNEIVKFISHGGLATFFLDKCADMGCSDSCPFLGNGEYRLPGTTVEEPSVAGPAVAENVQSVPGITMPDEKKPPEAEKVPAMPVEKKLSQQRPCFYPEMRGKSDDLLFNGYNTGLKLILDCNTDVMLPDGSKQAKLGFEASTDKMDINICLDYTMNPGIKGFLSLQQPSQVILRYRKPLLAVTGSSRFEDWPVVSVSAVLGTKNIVFGADVSVDTKSLTLCKHSCGLYLSKGDATASVIMENDDVLLASYHHKLDDVTSVGADLHHTVSSNESTLTVGCSHVIDSSTMFKAKVCTDGFISVVLRRNLKPKCYVSVSAESDCNFRRPGNGTKFGLCIALVA